MDDSQRREYFYHLVLMLFAPAISLYHGLRFNSLLTYRSKRWLLIVFVTIAGSALTISPSNDAYRHQEAVDLYYSELSFSQFLQDAENILLLRENQSGSKDLFIHVVSYFVGSVLGLPGLFFTVVGFVFGYFYAGSIFRLLQFHDKRKKYHWLFYVFLTIFILFLSIQQMSTVRTWTGFWILFYACLSYYRTKKRKYLLLMFVPPLVHMGYFILAVPAWGVLVFGDRPKLYAFAFALSFFVSVPSSKIVESLGDSTEVVEQEANAYHVTEEVAESRDKKFSVKAKDPFYIVLQKSGLFKWNNFFFVGIIILSGIYWKRMSVVERHLFSIGILTLALSNMTGFLFAVQNRSFTVGMGFVYATALLMFRRNEWLHAFAAKRRWGWDLLRLSGLVFGLNIILLVAGFIYVVSVYLIAFPFLPWLINDVNYSIRELLGFLLPFG